MKTRAYMCGLLWAILAAVAIMGCGGDGDESASAAEPLSKTQFTKKAGAACEKAEKAKQLKLVELFGTKVRSGSVSERKIEEGIVDLILPVYQKLIVELAQLNPPATDKAQIDRIIASYRSALKKAESNPARLMTTDPFEDAYLAAQRYGIEHCVF